eukprot:scaffold33080_cov75-Phaeocystis_antarctica.AAC.3
MVERLRTAELRDAALERRLRQCPNGMARQGCVHSVHGVCAARHRLCRALQKFVLPVQSLGIAYRFALWFRIMKT